MFFFTGLLFWARVIDPGPLRPRLCWPARIAYRGRRDGRRLGARDHARARPPPDLCALRALAHRPGGISALTDQQLAAGMMWVPGSLAYAIAMMIGVYRWLEPEPEARAAEPGAHDHLRRTDRPCPLFADSFLAGSLLTLLLPLGC